jgi:putative oxidoreductase
MNALTSTGARFIFAIPFAVFGLFHFMNASAMAGMVPIPGGVFWVYLTGAAMLAASISIIIRKQAYLACLLLALLLAIYALSIHLPGAIGGNQPSVTNLLKDLALSGAALCFAGRFANDPAF